MSKKKKKEKYNIPFNYTIAFLEKVIVSANSITDPKIIKQLNNRNFVTNLLFNTFVG